MKGWMCASLFICSLLMGCDPAPDWSDKDVAFLMSKLESRHVLERGRAIRELADKTGARDKIVAALTHKLLNDTHEQVRSNAAEALGSMNAAEAVPALVKSLHLPATERGKPLDFMDSPGVRLPVAVGRALEEIGTPEALAAIEEFRALGTQIIESSVPDGATDVDADFINQNGITLRFSANTSGWCRMFAAGYKPLWRKSFKTTDVTLKPRRGDPKLVDGADYTLKCLVTDDWDRQLKITITFATKE